MCFLRFGENEILCKLVQTNVRMRLGIIVEVEFIIFTVEGDLLNDPAEGISFCVIIYILVDQEVVYVGNAF